MRGGYSTIVWVEIQTLSADQDAAVLELVRVIHLPGHRIENGFRLYGYEPEGVAVDYLWPPARVNCRVAASSPL